MKLVDQAGGLAAMRHAQSRVVTVAIDQMTFYEPIRVGDFVTLNATLTYVGRTSMEVRVEVIAEDPIVGTKTHTNTAYLVYVALDNEGRPKSVPRLIAETDLEKKRMEDGKSRQKVRLERRRLEDRRVDQ
jgi:acyl-CoA hydrolase